MSLWHLQPDRRRWRQKVEVNAPLVVLRGSPSIQRESRWCSSAQRLWGHMGISLKLEAQQRAGGEVKAHMVRLWASRCRSRLNQMMCHTTACWLVVNNETLIRAVRRNFCGGNYRGRERGSRMKVHRERCDTAGRDNRARFLSVSAHKNWKGPGCCII